MAQQQINRDELSDVNSIQQIPSLFTGMGMSVANTVREALDVARELSLIPEKSPLRTIWYALVKKAIENNGTPIKKGDKTFYDTFAKMIKGGAYYADYNIQNEGIVWKKQYSRGFGETYMCLEKESYFSVFKNFSELMGVSIYCGGGQPSQSGTEYIMSQYYSTPEKINLYTITDFDPAGLNIANTFYDQFSLFAGRKGCEVVESRVGTNPEYYQSEELADALYSVKNPSFARWHGAWIEDLRDKYEIPDTKGLEVESLPADPTPIFSTLFPEYHLRSWKGQARIRLIALHKLIKDFGVDAYFRNWIVDCFHNNSRANHFVNINAGMDELDSVESDIVSCVSDITELIGECLEEDKSEVESQLDEWKEDLIEELAEDEEYQHDFTQRIITRVAADTSYLPSHSFEDRIPDSIKDYEISTDKQEKIVRCKNRLSEILVELEELKAELEDEDSEDEDYDDED